jgi:hypothetical protein
MSSVLYLRGSRRQVARTDSTGEILALVAAIAKRRICGVAAPADRHNRPATKAEGFAFLVHNLEITFDTNRTIVENRQFGSGHECLRKITIVCAASLQDNERHHRIQEAAKFAQAGTH